LLIRSHLLKSRQLLKQKKTHCMSFFLFFFLVIKESKEVADLYFLFAINVKWKGKKFQLLIFFYRLLNGTNTFFCSISNWFANIFLLLKWKIYFHRTNFNWKLNRYKFLAFLFLLFIISTSLNTILLPRLYKTNRFYFHFFLTLQKFRFHKFSQMSVWFILFV